MKDDNIEKMNIKHAQDRKEDLEMLSKGICPWTKQPCQSMKAGYLMLKSNRTLESFEKK